MDEKLYEKLLTPEGINEVLNADFSYRRSRDPKSIEAFIQKRHRDMMEASLDIARAQIILAKTEVDRYLQREKEHLRQNERSYLHPSFFVKANGYTWSATWRKGGYCTTSTGQYLARHTRIPTQANGNYAIKDLMKGPKWSQDMARTCEGELVKHRILNEYLMKVRDSIYRSSKQWRQYFDTQDGCREFAYRAPALTQEEVEEVFAQRFQLPKRERK